MRVRCGAPYSNFWFKRTPLAVVLRINGRKAFKAKCAFSVKNEQRAIEEITLTLIFQYNT